MDVWNVEWTLLLAFPLEYIIEDLHQHLLRKGKELKHWFFHRTFSAVVVVEV